MIGLFAFILSGSLALAAPAPGSILKAAAAKVDITPDLNRHRIYMAGYGAKGRRPRGIHDPLYARLLVLSDGRKTVGIVGLDLLGFYRNDVEELRALSGFTGDDRYLFVAATHQHAGPDTLGLWGPLPGVSGVDHVYHGEIKRAVAKRLRELELELREARVFATTQRIDPRGLCRDSRNPVIINPDLGLLDLREPGGQRIATVVNWSCHPEVLGSKNELITADYPGPLCDTLETVLKTNCLFLSGTIGGLMTPDTRSGREDFYESHRIGVELAERVIRLLPGAAFVKEPRLGFKSELVLVPVENSRYLSFLPALTFGHVLRESSGRPIANGWASWMALKHVLGLLPPEGRPWVESEVSRVDIGTVRLLGLPGEFFPELLIGGYDGSFRAGHPLIDSSNPNPPDLSQAPKGPYLRERMRGSARLIVGLANDELGYILPEYDFKIQPTLTLLPRLPGHHYEETNSIGRSATGILMKAVERLALGSDGKD